jgi:peptidyl-prolyl cis-trans isomerase SDCCAG10
MSGIYNVEPPTAGKIVLKTTYGDLDIELWPKEAPLATRNFTQLCMEGYYDGSVFHRVVRNFMIQGGDPTGTGTGGVSVYGRPFKDEFHSRLLFRHRGILACVNENTPDSNGSQFFITLDRAEHLNRTATIFGKVVGDTIHNLSRFNEVDTDQDDRPEDPIYIEKATVLISPMEGIAPRKGKNVSEEQTLQQVDKGKRIPQKNAALMSFDEEELVDEYEIKPTRVVKDDVSIKKTVDTLPVQEEEEILPPQREVELRPPQEEERTVVPESQPVKEMKKKKSSRSLVEVQRQKYVAQMKEQKIKYGSKRKREHDTLNRIKGFAKAISKNAQEKLKTAQESHNHPDKVVTARLDDILHHE